MVAEFLKFIDLTKLPLRWWAVFSIVGLAVLFAPTEYAEVFGIADKRNEVRPYVGLITLVSIAFLSVNGVIHVWKRIERQKAIKANKVKIEAKKAKAISYLDGISIREAAILAAFYYQDCRTITLEATDPFAMTLANQGVIRQQGGYGHLMDWPFTVNDFVWEHIPHAISRWSKEELIEAFRNDGW